VAFRRSWRLLGYGGRALLPSRSWTGFWAPPGAAIFASLLRRAGRSEREALLGAAALGGTPPFFSPPRTFHARTPPAVSRPDLVGRTHRELEVEEAREQGSR